jgi:predicted negative regulator of RcsB-dependent stress response
MAYDLEEQEQLATLKGWWKDNANTLLWVVTAAAVGFAGWRGWDYYQAKQSAEASMQYEALVKAVQGGDAKALRDAGGQLAENYPRTLYASMGALASARFYFEREDLKSAKAQLQWVVDRGQSDEMRDIARLRLAGIALDEKAYDEGLKLVEQKHAPAMAAQYAALKGDLLVAKNRADEAKAAYRLALEKADNRAGDAFRDSVRLRLDALGG